MKYFVNEMERSASGSTCYVELQKGRYCGKRWKKDSMSIHMDIFDETHLHDLFSSVVNFDYFGLTEITIDEWNTLVDKAHSIGGKIEEIISEIITWVEDNYKKENVFTICGI